MMCGTWHSLVMAVRHLMMKWAQAPSSRTPLTQLKLRIQPEIHPARYRCLTKIGAYHLIIVIGQSCNKHCSLLSAPYMMPRSLAALLRPVCSGLINPLCQQSISYQMNTMMMTAFQVSSTEANEALRRPIQPIVWGGPTTSGQSDQPSSSSGQPRPTARRGRKIQLNRKTFGKPNWHCIDVHKYCPAVTVPM